jgi:hypothetical protein
MITSEKEITMSRPSKFLFVLTLIVFVLACNTVTQPIKDVQNGVGTVQSVASSLPIETIQALATNLPVETLQAVSSAMPNFGEMFNPQGTPVKEWNGIPIMTQATAGQEFPDAKSYSFKATATVKEAEDFYKDELVKLGWSSTVTMPSTDQGAVLFYSKDSSVLTVTITAQNDAIVVLLTSA